MSLRARALGAGLLIAGCGRINLGSHDAGTSLDEAAPTAQRAPASGTPTNGTATDDPSMDRIATEGVAPEGTSSDGDESARYTPFVAAPDADASRCSGSTDCLIECNPTFNRCVDAASRASCERGFRGFESADSDGVSLLAGGSLTAAAAFEAASVPVRTGTYSLRLGIAVPAGAPPRVGIFVPLCELGDQTASALEGQPVRFSVFPGAIIEPTTAPSETVIEAFRVYATTRPDELVGQSEPLTPSEWNDVSLLIPEDPEQAPLVGFELHVVLGSTPYTGDVFFDDIQIGGG